MRPLMPPVQTPDNLFHDGNPLTGELGTIVDAEHLNNEQAAIRDTQSELIAILTAAAMEPESTAGQLLAALNKLYAPLNDTLGALSSLVGGANKLPYFTSAKAAAVTALSSIGRDIVGKATVADVLTYLGLGEAAKRNVGTGANQIPDMSLFASSNTATAAAQKFPSGLILQCGMLNSPPNASSTYGMRFPMTFSRVLAVTVTLNVTGASGQPTVSATNVQNTGFNITVSPGSGYGSSADAYYIAMGY